MQALLRQCVGTACSQWQPPHPSGHATRAAVGRGQAKEFKLVESIRKAELECSTAYPTVVVDMVSRQWVNILGLGSSLARKMPRHISHEPPQPQPRTLPHNRALRLSPTPRTSPTNTLRIHTTRTIHPLVSTTPACRYTCDCSLEGLILRCSPRSNSRLPQWTLVSIPTVSASLYLAQASRSDCRQQRFRFPRPRRNHR